MQLKRIALALGIPEPRVQTRALSAGEALREAAQGGLPVMQGRPDDPMLAFLDL